MRGLLSLLPAIVVLDRLAADSVVVASWTTPWSTPVPPPLSSSSYARAVVDLVPDPRDALASTFSSAAVAARAAGRLKSLATASSPPPSPPLLSYAGAKAAIVDSPLYSLAFGVPSAAFSIAHGVASIVIYDVGGGAASFAVGVVRKVGGPTFGLATEVAGGLLALPGKVVRVPYSTVVAAFSPKVEDKSGGLLDVVTSVIRLPLDIATGIAGGAIDMAAWVLSVPLGLARGGLGLANRILSGPVGIVKWALVLASRILSVPVGIAKGVLGVAARILSVPLAIAKAVLGLAARILSVPIAIAKAILGLAAKILSVPLGLAKGVLGLAARILSVPLNLIYNILSVPLGFIHSILSGPIGLISNILSGPIGLVKQIASTLLAVPLKVLSAAKSFVFPPLPPPPPSALGRVTSAVSGSLPAALVPEPTSLVSRVAAVPVSIVSTVFSYAWFVFLSLPYRVAATLLSAGFVGLAIAVFLALFVASLSGEEKDMKYNNYRTRGHQSSNVVSMRKRQKKTMGGDGDAGEWKSNVYTHAVVAEATKAKRVEKERKEWCRGVYAAVILSSPATGGSGGMGKKSASAAANNKGPPLAAFEIADKVEREAWCEGVYSSILSVGAERWKTNVYSSIISASAERWKTDVYSSVIGAAASDDHAMTNGHAKPSPVVSYGGMSVPPVASTSGSEDDGPKSNGKTGAAEVLPTKKKKKKKNTKKK